ncbi:MAG: hypothetical protein JWQ96_2569 [Segetibacter sp.]|nr:hypothetical protein [Segetibacter sp.]
MENLETLNGETITEASLESSNSSEVEIQENINHYYNDRDEIDVRIMQLDDEWDIERVLQTEGALVTIVGTVLGLRVHKKWLALPLAASLVLLTGSVVGWGRPLPILRKLGFRTRAEIDKEKYALKALRGDFKYLLDVPNVVWNAVNK